MPDAPATTVAWSRSPRSSQSRSPASPARHDGSGPYGRGLGWPAIRGHRRRRVHRLAPRRGARAGGPRGRRDRLLHRLLRPGAEGGERAPRSTCAGSTSPRTSSTSAASTASSTSPASRACAASATSSRSTCARTCSRPSACSRRRRPPGSRVVFASSSSIYGEAERYPTPRGRAAAAALAVRDHEARRASTSPRAYARSFGLDAVVLRYFNVYGPRQRPDMAFTRIVAALAEGTAVRPLRRRRAEPRLHVRRRRRRRRRSRAMERRARGSRLQRRRRRRRRPDERDDRAARADRRPQRSTCARGRRSLGDQRRTKADTTRIRAELGWEPRTSARGGAAGAVGVGPSSRQSYPRRVSRPRPVPEPDLDAEQEVDLRSALRAGSPRAGGCPCSGSCSAWSSATCSRSAAARCYEAETRVVPRQPVHAGRRRRDPEQPRDEPADRRRDRPLGGGAEGGVPRERHPRLEAPRLDLDCPGDRGRPGPHRDDDALRDRRDGIRARRRWSARPTLSHRG